MHYSLVYFIYKPLYVFFFSNSFNQLLQLIVRPSNKVLQLPTNNIIQLMYQPIIVCTLSEVREQKCFSFDTSDQTVKRRIKNKHMSKQSSTGTSDGNFFKL